MKLENYAATIKRINFKKQKIRVSIREEDFDFFFTEDTYFSYNVMVAIFKRQEVSVTVDGKVLTEIKEIEVCK